MGAVLPAAEATCVGSEALAALLVVALAPNVLLLVRELALELEPKGLDAPWDCKAAKRFCMNAVTLCAIAGSVVLDAAALGELLPAAGLAAEEGLVPIPAWVKALTNAVAKVDANP